MVKKADPYQAVASRFDKTLLAKVNRSGGVQDVDLAKLRPRDKQPRRYFDERELSALAESIRSDGVRNPLHVRRTKDSDYEILAGERRFRAAGIAELERVPVIVHDLDDNEADSLAVLDNLHRSDLNPIEETEAILLLAQAALKVDRDAAIAKIRAAANVAKGRTQEGIGEIELTTLQNLFDRSIGRLTIMSFVNARLPLLKLPQEIYQAVMEGKLAYTVASLLKAVKSDHQRHNLLQQAISERLTRDELKLLIQKANQAPVSMRRFESQVKPARNFLGAVQLRRVPADKRSEFVKLVEEFTLRASSLLGSSGDKTDE